MAKKVTDINLSEISLVDKGANPDAFIMLMKRKTGGQNMEKLQKKYDALVTEKEALQKKYDDLVTEVEALKKNGEKLEADGKALQKQHDDLIAKHAKEPDPKDEMSEDVKKRFEDLEKKDKASSDLIAKLLDEKAEAIYLEKAKGYKNLPIKPEEFGPILKRVAGGAATEEDMKKMEEVLKAADEAIEQGRLFKEQGSDGPGLSGGDALKKVEAKAGELMKSDTSLSKAQAFTKVLEEDATLYDEYLSEQQ
jgi:predicted nuclease with TOPRIM domain